MHVSSNADGQILDLIGVGVGPFNLGLASLLAPIDSLECVFFDGKDSFNWHSGLLIEGCSLQVPFLADLVTMIDPTSQYSYLNYLHEQGRLYQFYFYENFHIPRVEYNRYCQWVSERLNNVLFSREVVKVEAVDSLFRVTVKNTQTRVIQSYLSRNVVIGVGTTPNWPDLATECKNLPGCIHSSDYLFSKKDLQRNKTITVIGGGQSAAEVFLDLLRDQPHYGYEINWLSRSDGFLPMEYSKLGLEHFSPDYIEHFHRLPEEQRKSTLHRQGNWYKGISFNTIREIYDCLYARSIEQRSELVIQARSQLERLEHTEEGYSLEFRHLDLQTPFSFKSEAVILATGYEYQFPTCLSALKQWIHVDAHDRPLVNRDYTLKIDGPKIGGKIFVQNGELHSHGIAAPDLGMGPYRSAMIINQLLGEEQYPVSTETVFQTFGIDKKWRGRATQNSSSPQLAISNIADL